MATAIEAFRESFRELTLGPLADPDYYRALDMELRAAMEKAVQAGTAAALLALRTAGQSEVER